ncbi:MAG: hypothetical protein ACP5U0_08975 [Caldisphaera sp.]
MREKDPKGILFESLNDYLIRSKDSNWYKALVLIYINESEPSEFFVTSKDYYDAIYRLYNLKVIKSGSYKNMVPFSKFCIYCSDKLRNLEYTSMRVLDDSKVIKFRNTKILDKTCAKIDYLAAKKRNYHNEVAGILEGIVHKKVVEMIKEEKER